MTDQKHQLPSHDELANKNTKRINSPKFPKIQDDFNKPLTQLNEENSRDVQDFCELNKDMIDAHPKPSVETKRKGRLTTPILAAISNFNLAKKLHKENLEHNPLPDTITDRMYKKLQMERHQDASVSLEDKQCATGRSL